MRETEKTMTFPVDGENMTFRLTKLDAFSGAKLLRLLSDRQEVKGGGHEKNTDSSSDTLSDLLFSLPDEVLENVMRSCLSHVQAMLPAGPIQLLSGDCWSVPEMEYETITCLKLTLEVMAWTLSGFFHESGEASKAGAPASSR